MRLSTTYLAIFIIICGILFRLHIAILLMVSTFSDKESKSAITLSNSSSLFSSFVDDCLAVESEDSFEVLAFSPVSLVLSSFDIRSSSCASL